MGRYILKRLLITIPVILGVAFLIFTILYFTPGDPRDVILGNTASAEEYAILTEQLGLDQPYIVRLGRFFRDTFLRFDFGNSYITKSSVAADILERFPRTLAIALVSMVFGVVIGVPLGVTAAVHQNRWQDRLCMTFSMVCSCVPEFWVALMLVVLFSVKLNWLPPFGIGGFEYYIIPGISIMLGSFAAVARQTRSSVLETLRADFVITARAQGFSEGRITYGYILPNSLIPVITSVGTHFARSIGGTIIIETIFVMPGMGQYLNTAINNRDYPVIQGGVVFLSILFCIIILLVDLLYAFVDPRIKAQYEAQGSKRRRKAS